MIVLSKDVIKRAQKEPKTMPAIYPPEDCRLRLIVLRFGCLKASRKKRK